MGVRLGLEKDKKDSYCPVDLKMRPVWADAESLVLLAKPSKSNTSSSGAPIKTIFGTCDGVDRY